MNPTDAEILEDPEHELTEAEYDELEFQLRLRAGALHWTGDPLRQPTEVVVGLARYILSKRPAVPAAPLPDTGHDRRMSWLSRR